MTIPSHESVRVSVLARINTTPPGRDRVDLIARTRDTLNYLRVRERRVVLRARRQRLSMTPNA